MADHQIGVVTVTYNSANVLDGFFNSLTAQIFNNFVLYVVDNASSDTTLNSCRSANGIDIRLIENSINVGVAAANNQGVSAAISDGCTHILLLNNDTEFPAELFGELLSASERMNTGLVAPKIHYYEPTDLLWYAGGEFTTRYCYSSEHIGLDQFDTGQFDNERYVTYAPTCCLLVAADIFHDIGNMDETYFCYWDDADFCMRAMRNGYKIGYTPKYAVRHKVSSLSGGSESNFYLYYFTRNRVYFLRKHLPIVSQVYFGAAYIVRIFASVLVGKNDYGRFKLRLRAYFDGWKLRKT